MRTVARKVAIFILGWVLIVVGLVLALPGVPGPGLLIAMVGLLILASEYQWAKRLVERFRRRFPRLAALLEEAAQKARGWVGMKRSAATAPHSDTIARERP
jgi:uncharacterized protein (TIGR02611 family)